MSDFDQVEFPGEGKFADGEENDYVLMVGSALCLREKYRAIYEVGPSRKWTSVDRAAVKAFQEDLGWSGEDANGIPGPFTWQRLGLGSAKSRR